MGGSLGPSCTQRHRCTWGPVFLMAHWPREPPLFKGVIQKLTWRSDVFERITRLLANSCALVGISVTDCDRKPKIIAA